jgi:RNA polymerase sigma factor (sigma-70 family)
MLAGARAEATETHAPAERRREALVVTPPTPPPSGAPLSPDEARRFREVVLRHADAAYNLALRLSRREDVAEDIVHDAYVRALAAFPSLRGDGRSWILTIVRNRFYDWIREQRLRSTLPLTRPANSDDDGETDWDPPDLEQDSPEQALVKKVEAGALRALIDGLPARWREVLILREMEELSYREIAAITESPIGSVMSRLARARVALAAAWRKREAEVAEVSS